MSTTAVIGLHQIDVSKAAVVPVSHQHFVMPQLVTPSGGATGPVAEPQESVGIVGVVSRHANWLDAAEVATRLSELTSCQYTLYSDTATPAHVNKISRQPGNMILRDLTGGSLKPVNALTTDELRLVSKIAFEGTGDTAIANMNGAVPITSAYGNSYTQVIQSSADKWVVTKYSLEAGVPKTLTFNGSPQVIIDRGSSSDYIVYAVFGHVTFEAIAFVPGNQSSPVKAVGQGGGIFRTILGLVETIVKLARQVADLIDGNMLTTVLDSEGNITYPNLGSSPDLGPLCSLDEFCVFRLRYCRWSKNGKTHSNLKVKHHQKGKVSKPTKGKKSAAKAKTFKK